MTLVDSSAWIELFRATGSETHLRLKAALESRAVLATTDVVLMEILAGARDDDERDWLRRFLYDRRFLRVQGTADFESAAEIHRLCRRGGETPRRLTDCLIAAIAIRKGAELLCLDSDFETIARHTPLRLAAA